MKVSIEGIHGSGKTTILNLLQSLQYNTIIHDETSKQKWLNLYLKDKRKYVLGHNLNLILNLTRDKEDISDIHSKSKFPITLYEDSLYTLHNIHSNLQLKSNKLDNDEYLLQHDLINRIGWEPDCIIYLDCSPDTCYERLCELDQHKHLSLNSLETIYKEYNLHFNTICKIPIFRVNAEDNIENVFYHVLQILYQIIKFSKN